MTYIIKNIKSARTGSYTGDLYCTETDMIVGAFEESAKSDIAIRVYFTNRKNENRFREEVKASGLTIEAFINKMDRASTKEKV